MILTSRFPYPLEKGDKLRIYHQLKALAKHHMIFLVSLSDHPVAEEDFIAVKKLCERVEVLNISKFTVRKNLFLSVFKKMPAQVALFFDENAKRKFHQLVAEIKPDHIYCQLIRTAPYATNLDVPKTLDFMDNYSRWTTKLAAHKSFPPFKWLLQWEAKKVAAFEQKMFENFDGHTVISAQDQQSFNFAGSNQIRCISNGVDTEFFQPNSKVEKRFDVAFVGNLGYINNVEAAKFIAQKVVPLVLEKMPTCKFLIAGARPVSEVQKLGNEQVTIQGWLDDIRDAYSWSKIFVAPIFLAVGQQNKILEAMSMGLPCVTTPQVNNAIGATPDESILIASSARTFADQILFLLENNTERRHISESGLSFVQKNFSWESAVTELRKLMKEIHPNK